MHDLLYYIYGPSRLYLWGEYSFIDLYNSIENQNEKEMLFSDIKNSSKKIGKALSKKIYEYFCI